MVMTSRERMLTALQNERPDRLPCQVHGWMPYYLENYLDGMDWYQAYDKFDMDFAIYVSPSYEYSDSDLQHWQKNRKNLGTDDDGNHHWEETIITPLGNLHHAGAYNEITPWETECLIKTPEDFDIWNKYFPVPQKADFSHIEAAKNQLKDRGIIRCHPFYPGQGSPWQAFCTLVGTEEAIMMTFDNSEFVHFALKEILKKSLKVTNMWQGIPADMVETGGGAGSNTVISPKIFKEFCVPYDKKQHNALNNVGLKTVYHLCGGVMQMLDLVVENGADGLETMTPPSMGGDCDLAVASQKVGEELFFIGGFDQNQGFEKGTPEVARKLVFDCFEATKDQAGYIIAPSDHFFFGDPQNIQAFVDASKECTY